MKLYFLLLCLPAVLHACFFTCSDLKFRNRRTKSGVYMINIPSGRFRVYCEMEINGGGYTFISRKDMRRLKHKDMRYLFRRRRSVLLRLLKKQPIQPYTVIEPLHRRPNLGVLLSSYRGYTRPKNIALKPYFFLGILPAKHARKKNIQGFKSNRRIVKFKNCDKNPNSYFAFFANLKNKKASRYHFKNKVYEKRGVAVNWRKTAKLKPQGCNMPKGYFFLTELHFGGCGTYTSSDRWKKRGFLGTAIGLR